MANHVAMAVQAQKIRIALHKIDDWVQAIAAGGEHPPWSPAGAGAVFAQHLDSKDPHLVELGRKTFSAVRAYAETLQERLPAGISVNVWNDDSADVTIGDVTLNESDAGTSTAVFTITLDAEVNRDVVVTYATADNTALAADGDYATISAATVTFPAHSSAGATRTLAVNVNGDSRVELDESFHVDLTNIAASGRDVSTSRGRAAGNILNDDSATLTIEDVTTAEGDSGVTAFVFTVTLDADVDTSLAFDFATADDSADTSDYTGPEQTGL